MNTEESKNIEKLIDKVMLDNELHSTSTDFSNTIMAQVEQMNQQKVFEYKPLISKKIWVLICVSIIALLTYITLYGNLAKSKWMNYFELDFSKNLIPELNFSNTTIYAATIVSVLFLVQIIILKNYFNKRLSI
ncbi:hypothetical protein [Aureibaculum conchae]|uniref:hypothetical protein n=1 Tax=Aureibaculum sp. 2308TA14-22 TaxID=3108392 RepID=UPI0033976D18